MSGGNGPLKVKICLITVNAKFKPMLIFCISRWLNSSVFKHTHILHLVITYKRKR